MSEEKKINLNEIKDLMERLHDIIDEAEESKRSDEEWMTKEQKDLKHKAEWEDFEWEQKKKKIDRQGPIRIWLTGSVREEMNELIIKKIRQAADYPERDIELYISTYGGSVYEMIGICDAILSVPNHVKTIGSGKIMSAGGPILVCGNERIMTENSTLMIHDLWGGSHGSPSEQEAEIAQSRVLQKIIANYFARFSDLEQEALIEMMEKKKDSYFSAKQALEMGIIDFIEEQIITKE